jgi:hypothetical protein
MNYLMDFVPYLVVFILAAVPAPYLHEGSHWFVGWVGDTQPKVQWTFRVVPNGVEHGTIESMDSGLIRLSGAAPFCWIPVWILGFLYFLVNWTPENLFAMLVPFYTVFFLATESDVIAVREPERFRDMEVNDAFQRNPLFFPNWLIPDWLPRF